jgi:hypothetical protein
MPEGYICREYAGRMRDAGLKVKDEIPDQVRNDRMRIPDIGFRE